jgi:hypothetical protein
VYRRGPGWLALAVDARGNPRPELAAALIESLAEARPAKPADWGLEARWKAGIDALAEKISALAPEDARLEAAAFFRIVPAPATQAPRGE